MTNEATGCRNLFRKMDVRPEGTPTGRFAFPEQVELLLAEHRGSQPGITYCCPSGVSSVNIGAKLPTKQAWPADKVERRPINGLIPYARNARTHSDEQVAQIAASMREWGWTNPVLIGDDGTIIAGHGRVLAARKLGFTEVPVMVAHGWTAAQKRAYVLADNQIALNAGWDLDLLGNELRGLDEDGFDLDLLGFPDLDRLMTDPTEGMTDPDDVPEPPVDPVTRPGDLWLLGAYYQCEDCGKKYTLEVGGKMDECPCG